jgi:transketolase
MAAISRANLRLAGSHAGVSIGEDGPSQMALEDIASLRASTRARCCSRATRTRPRSWSRRWPTPKGSSFLRTLRRTRR